MHTGRILSVVFSLLSSLALLGCAAPAGTGSVAGQAQPLAAPQAFRTWTPADQQRWSPVVFPGKQRTSYQLTQHDLRSGTQADAQSAVSMLRQSVHVPPEQLGALKFSWHVPALIDGADMGQRDADDSPVRVVLAFEGDRSQFSARNAMLNELSRALTGEEMPYATLMYVWCNHRPVGTVIANPRTDRIQKIVVESGAHRLKHWQDYERNIRADFEKAFGEPPGALVAIGLMTDSDNTRSSARAWYGDVQLVRPLPPP
jgi:hypothetical protein